MIKRTMQRAMLKCNGVQTQVFTEGRWVEEELAKNGNKHVVVVVPGNPGVPEFYEGFIKSLKSRLPSEVPVWIVGHAGHVQPSNDLAIAMPNDSMWHEHYGLTAQAQHKKEFIKKYVPEDAKLHVIGHSIGCWFTLNLLKDDSVSKNIVKCYMLFPTIEEMAKTRYGWFFTKVVARIAWLLVFLSWIFQFFPLALQILLLHAFGSIFGIPAKCDNAVLQMLNPNVLRRILRLANEEMKYVRERDDELLSRNTNKLWFYYGTSDGWTPVRYYKNMKAKHPNMDAQLCKRGIQHSFVLHHDKEMGQIVGDVINENISKT